MGIIDGTEKLFADSTKILMSEVKWKLGDVIKVMEGHKLRTYPPMDKKLCARNAFLTQVAIVLMDQYDFLPRYKPRQVMLNEEGRRDPVGTKFSRDIDVVGHADAIDFPPDIDAEDEDEDVDSCPEARESTSSSWCSSLPLRNSKQSHELKPSQSPTGKPPIHSLSPAMIASSSVTMANAHSAKGIVSSTPQSQPIRDRANVSSTGGGLSSSSRLSSGGCGGVDETNSSHRFGGSILSSSNTVDLTSKQNQQSSSQSSQSTSGREGSRRPPASSGLFSAHTFA